MTAPTSPTYRSPKSGYIDVRDNKHHLLFRYDAARNLIEIKRSGEDQPTVIDMSELRAKCLIGPPIDQAAADTRGASLLEKTHPTIGPIVHPPTETTTSDGTE